MYKKRRAIHHVLKRTCSLAYFQKMAMLVCDFRVFVNGDNRWVDKGNRLLTLVKPHSL